MNARPADVTTPYGWTEAIDAVKATRASITETRTWINERIEHYRDLQSGNETGDQPQRGTEPVNDDERRSREILAEEELDRQRHDLQSDGVLDGDYNRQPGDDGAPEPDLEG